MKTSEKQFIDWENSVFGYGYGTGEKHTLKALKDFFNSLEDRRYHYEELENKLTPIVAWLMINILCKADIIEYGTSPRNGWLTKKGEELKDFLKTKTEDELYTLVMSTDETYIYCSEDYCNCGETSTSKKCVNNKLF